MELQLNNDFIIKPFRILNFATFLQYQRYVMPISFLFYLHNGLNFSDFILCQSIFNATCLIAKIPMGFLGDLFSKKTLLILSYFLFMSRVILWIFFKGFYIVLAGEILYGLFKALYRGNVDSYMYDWLKQNNLENKIIQRYGKLSFWTSLGSALSCIGGVILYKYFGFRGILIIELLLQIVAVALLFCLPSVNSNKNEQSDKTSIKSFMNSVVELVKNNKINYYIYYSAMITGLTGVLVCNFQPLLKMSYAPIIIFGIVSFVNQLFRGLGGLFAKKFTSVTSKKTLFGVEYLSIIFSFLFIIAAYKIHHYIPTLLLILGVCTGILFFVIFNVYTVSKVHQISNDNTRSTSSSTNTFWGDFASFLLLLIFKYFYDSFGIETTLITYLIIFSIALFPFNKVLNKLV